MTLYDAVMDPGRPLTVTPEEWIEQERRVLDSERDATDAMVEESSSGDDPLMAKLDFGIDRMVDGCRMAMSAYSGMSRSDCGKALAVFLEEAGDILKTALGPYLVDMLDAREKFRREWAKENANGRK